jgi:Zn-dependent peptidase ImmA (M78 family)/DNA-binding XRE family transcriptional regulator
MLPGESLQKGIDGDRVRLARESRLLSQEELADRISVSAPTIHRWEKNVSPPDQYISLVSSALDYPESFFSRTKIITPHISPPQYRTTTRISTRNQKAAEARAYIRYDQILRAFNKWVDYKWGFTQYNPDEYGMRAPAIIAKMTRQEWGINRGPIENLVAAIESRGILVFIEDFEDSELDGMSFYSDGRPPIIYLNKDRPGERMRFTLAHELGHLIMHRIHREDMEREAHAFAAEFLMPDSDIQNDLDDLSIFKLINLKAYWKVSIQAILYRAKELNHISTIQSQKLWRELAYKGFKKNEPYPLPPETPNLPRILIEMIHKTTRLPIDKIADEMGTKDFDIQLNYLGKRLALRS